MSLKGFWLCAVFLLIDVSSLNAASVDVVSDNSLPSSIKDVKDRIATLIQSSTVDAITQEIVKGVRENRTIKFMDLMTVEPFENKDQVDGRSNSGSLARFFNTRAFNFEFGNYVVRLAKSDNKDSSVSLEIEENRGINGEGRRRGKKVLRIFLPLLLGFKAASTLIVAIAAVALLTFKAFLASKLALLVTGSMAIKKLMEGLGGGFGMQHHPYLYSQYPLDFPTAGAHPAYSMPNSAYATPEMYGATGLGTHTHEMLQQPLSQEQPHDNSGQYSQNINGFQNPNITAKLGQSATKRWDGIKRKPMYYERPSSDAYSSYQEYDN